VSEVGSVKIGFSSVGKRPTEFSCRSSAVKRLIGSGGIRWSVSRWSALVGEKGYPCWWRRSSKSWDQSGNGPKVFSCRSSAVKRLIGSGDNSVFRRQLQIVSGQANDRQR
jgi:hypothetical protein